MPKLRTQPSAKSQEGRILAYLQEGKSLTALRALSHFHCMALSQRVTRLRQWGWPIDSREVKLTSGKRIAEYSLPRQEWRING